MTKPRLLAARLVAEDEQSDEAIAAACGVTRATLHNWKQRPEFAAKVEEHRRAWDDAIKAEGIANRKNRIAAANDRWRKLQQVIAERAVDPRMADVPGGTTGLLVHQVKSVGFGENNQVIDEYVVDTGLLAELRAHEKQAAQDLGQWSERSKIDLDIDGEVERLAREFGRPVEEVRADLMALVKGESV